MPSTGRIVATLLATVAVAGTVSSCGDSKGNEPQKESTASEKGEAVEEEAGAVPRSLGEVESGAEDTIDFAQQGERSKVIATARRLRRSAGQAATDAREAGVPEERISALKDRVRRLEGLASRADLVRISIAANQISALMSEFYARYEDPVPPQVLKLDYLEREAQLRSVAGDVPLARSAVNDLWATWARLRPRVLDIGGRRIAAGYTRHVTSMRQLARGTDREALEREAAIGLELVDELEHQFRQA